MFVKTNYYVGNLSYLHNNQTFLQCLAVQKIILLHYFFLFLLSYEVEEYFSYEKRKAKIHEKQWLG